jgi:hypothetical protein
MITEATLAVKFGLAVDDVIDAVHPVPHTSAGRSNTPVGRFSGTRGR